MSNLSRSESDARFRSATEFPTTVDTLEQAEANALYAEMRECLIFTNRSRAQLVRWNNRHKQDKLELREKAEWLKGMVSQLMVEKQNLTRGNQQIVSDLELEISSMAIHLDRLADAFEPFADLDNVENSTNKFLSTSKNIADFLQTVKSLVIWWCDEQEPPTVSGQSSRSLLNSFASRSKTSSDVALINSSILEIVKTLKDQHSEQEQYRELNAETWTDFTLSSAMRDLEDEPVEYTREHVTFVSQ